mgnify:CR=1 FL=1|jgi:outer membrane protein OmpA-like peptidoglycan-associated protein
MFRRSLIVPFLLALLPVAAAAWVLTPAFLDMVSAPQSPEPQSNVQQTALTPSDLEAVQPREGSEVEPPAFDVVRISPEGGVSVFAGTAPPHATVTVTADGKLVGTTRADERGEWTLVTEHHFTNPEPVLGLSAIQAGQPRLAEGEQQLRMAEPRSAEIKSASEKLDPPARMMRNFEDMVAAARTTVLNTGQAAENVPVPVPIQFVFRKAKFTDQGRKAVELLSEYLRLKKPESIVLTGHADERGSEAFNIELSRLRLQAVADYLRRNGYQGRLILIPKGSSEPYRGVDRSKYSRRTLWQLDRRVELVLDPDTQRRSVVGGSSSIAR